MYINVPFSKIKFLELLNNHKILCKSCLNRDKPCLTKYNRALFVHTTVKSKSYQRIPQARLDPNTRTSYTCITEYIVLESSAQPYFV